MTEKRFYIDHSGDLWDRQSNDILMLDFGNEKAVYVNAVLDCMNELNDENEQLKQELFDSECECIEVHYHDNEVRRDNKIEDLKIEFKERFGRDFE